MRIYFDWKQIFYVEANILGKRQYFNDFAISFACLCNEFCLIFCCKYCVYFQYLFMHFVCANIFGANVLKSRFKIDVVIKIICSIVIIINCVLTLQVSMIADLAK